MRYVAVVGVALAAWSAAFGADGQAGADRYPGAWRSMAYQLPGAYRFIDRLSLTEEQQKALDKVFKDWTAKRTGAYAAATKALPALSAEDQKNAEKVREYFAKRTELVRAAEVPPPVDLVKDILTEEQLARVSEAGKVVEGWNGWLTEHLGTYSAKLDEILGPAPPEPAGAKRYAYQLQEGILKGGALLGRLHLTESQEAALQELRKQYYAEYTAMTGPLGVWPGSSQFGYEQANAVRSAVSTRAWTELRDKYRGQVEKVLTGEQRARFAKALQVVEERDEAVWKRYVEFVSELSAILPPAAPQGAATTQSPAEKKPEEKPKKP